MQPSPIRASFDDAFDKTFAAHGVDRRHPVPAPPAAPRDEITHHPSVARPRDAAKRVAAETHAVAREAAALALRRGEAASTTLHLVARLLAGDETVARCRGAEVSGGGSTLKAAEKRFEARVAARAGRYHQDASRGLWGGSRHRRGGADIPRPKRARTKMDGREDGLTGWCGPTGFAGRIAAPPRERDADIPTRRADEDRRPELTGWCGRFPRRSRSAPPPRRS